MKKLLSVILVIILCIGTLASEPIEKEKKTFHFYTESVMLFGYPTFGATLDAGINFDTITIAFYLRLNHLFRPLGSGTGNLTTAEELGEAGLSFKVRTYQKGRFNVNVGINTGWYQQWIMLSSNSGVYNLAHNGLMIRPEGSIGWRLTDWWNVELGLFYQTPLYPNYDGYKGWGVFVKLM